MIEHNPMLPTPPECGSPCALCESLAHLLAKAREENAALKAELESVRKGSAKVCQELRNELARLNGQTRWQCTCGGTDCEGRRENAELLTDKERLEKLLDINVRVPTRDGWWHFNCRSDVDAYRAGR